MSLAPWRSLVARALHRNRSNAHSRYLQLATVKPNGRPANRTIVFRDYLEDSDTLAFTTDARSAKAEQIERYPWGEACWYFTGSREQFRLSGPLKLVTAQTTEAALAEARKMIWGSLSERARQQFTWPEPDAPKANRSAFEQPAPPADEPAEQYCLLTLEPQEVIHLELKGDPQNRTAYVLIDAGWQSEAVNP